MKYRYIKITLLFALAIFIILIPTACSSENDTDSSTKKDTATTSRTASEKDVQTELRNAAVAMESYYTDQTTYPLNIADLAKWGYKPNEGVSIKISSAGGSSYCLEAAAKTGTTTWHFDSTAGSVEQGSC